MKSKTIIILAMFFGLLTGYLIYDYLIKLEQSVTNLEYTEVVVAEKYIPAKTLITADMVAAKKIPVDYKHPQAAGKKEEVVGNISLAPFVEGEALLRQKIASISEVKNGLAYAVPPGKRALTVSVDEVSGVAGFIKPGDRVDVVATVNIPDSSGTKETPYAIVVLQDLTVLAVGKESQEKVDSKVAGDYKTVTLAVTVDDSRPLVLASQKGNIRLMLRTPADNSQVPTYPFKATNFLH